jgi:small subunit ribosomal protein S8
MTDPIADMLTRLRNANTAFHDDVAMPSSKLKEAVARILEQEGYILRVYSKAEAVPPVLGGMGIAILSTNEGLLTDREARKRRVGGEILCQVW